MSPWTHAAIIAALLGTATVGGIFFAFSTFIMEALKRIPPAEGIRAMQSINRVVITPAFLGIFFGTAILSLTLAVLRITATSDQPLPHWLLIGALNYLAGTFAVTVIGNVPLNNRLASLRASEPSTQDYWPTYLKRWTLLNHIRTAAALLATLCFTMRLNQS